METNEMVITIPEGYEIDKENSTFECIKFKKKVKINTWKDLKFISGIFINSESYLKEISTITKDSNDKNVFISKKYAKSALALAQISQLMPYYGGEITEEEWKNVRLKKYGVLFYNSKIATNIYYDTKQMIGFHTEEQLNRFLSFPENIQLVKDLYMVD